MRKLVLLTLTVLIGWVGQARADNVDDLIRKLHDSDYKVRLSAALNLGKLGDAKAVPALTDALSDSDKTIRGVAAAALGKIVNGSVEDGPRNTAIQALLTASTNDSDSFVRSQAQKSYSAVSQYASSGSSGSSGTPSGKWVYVDVKLSANGNLPGSVLPAAQSELESELRKQAPMYLTKLPGGAQASAATAAFGLITNLTLQTSGATVSCKISMVLATYPQSSAFGFANGSGSVDADNTGAKAIEDAAKDCMNAVVDDLIDSKVIPTIKSRAGVP